jgi:coenzyme F420-reducing hydrogenase delta subunit
MLPDIYNFYDKMERNNILLSFKGDVTSDLLTSILQILENKLDTLQEEPKVKKKVYNVLVECLQNLYHHIDDVKVTLDKGKSAIFLIGKKENQYRIITGNYIQQDSIARLDERLSEINKLSPEELKEYYKKVLANGEISAKGGGGLGMLDIARKTGQKLDYSFIPIDSQFSFFSLNILI